MIDRSYLPFQSARDYQDVKMQKWMGFFLSEHTSALTNDDNNKIVPTSQLSYETKLLLLNQAYSQQLTIFIQEISDSVVHTYTGRICYFDKTKLLLKTQEAYITITIEDLMTIHWIEEEYYEST